MNSFEQMISDQLGIIPQVNGYLTNFRFWKDRSFVDHFSDYLYAYLMRETSSKYTLKDKESYD